MIFTERPKKIRVMFTAFRDGLQSSFGGKVRLHDILPAMKAAAEAGIRHFEFGGGARYQAPYFYLGEDPFEDMQTMRDTVGPDVDLQILTRSVSGVTLTTQSPEGLELQARLMKEHGTTWDRNFDFMNDVRSLINTGRPIVKSGNASPGLYRSHGIAVPFGYGAYRRTSTSISASASWIVMSRSTAFALKMPAEPRLPRRSMMRLWV